MRSVPLRVFVGVALLVALLLAGGLSFYASGSPDGLNRVADDVGFADTESDHAVADSPLAGYETSGVGSARASRAVAGVAGCVAVLAVTGVLVHLSRRRRPDEDPRDADVPSRSMSAGGPHG